MTDYKIFSDSTSDITPELMREIDVEILPLTFTIDGKDYQNTIENPQLKAVDFYNLLRDGKSSSTSQINMITFKDAFTPSLKTGVDVLYIGLSSGLSSTFDSALMAAEELSEEYPDRKIILVDSLSASMGLGLFVYLAAQKKNEGMTIDEVATWLEDNKLKLAHWFTVEDLNHLKRGGRLSAAAALVGTMLSIKPVLHVDDDGHLIPIEKIRGRRNSLDALVNHMEKSAVNPKEMPIFISHGDSLKDAQYVEAKIKEKLGVQKVYINDIGPVIGSHAGPGTVALFFMADKRL